jgi:nucleoredoxin
MNFRPTALLLFLLVLPLANAQETRTWTSASGKTLEAAFVELKFDQVVLRSPDGETIQIRLNQLSGPDQIYARSQAPGAGAPGAGLRGAPAVEKEVPPALDDLFGKRLVGLKGKRISTADLVGKKIGIYFTASWCPPCRAFTPDLVKAYNQLQTEGKPFEVVLVTSDRDKAAMEKYMKDYDMPFVAVPFGDKRIDALKKKFTVTGIPKFVVIDDAGQTLSADARGEISARGAAAFDKW